MEYRQLGNSGLKVSVLGLGAATFGGEGDFFKAFGEVELGQATRMIDIAMDAGVNFFDTADVYSQGRSEEILGKALGARRDKVLISTKGTFSMGPGPNDKGSSRHHLTEAINASLKRLGTDYIDLYQLHGFDPLTPVEETLQTLDDFVRAGKIRYIGCSNFSSWHIMKSLAVSERYGWSRYVAHQAYYSLVGRDYEWDLLPVAKDQGVGAVVWSPLGWGRLTGKLRRGQDKPKVSRLEVTADKGPPVEEEYLYRVVEAIDDVSAENGKSVPQIALNWLTQKPTVSTILIGARNEKHLQDNLGAVGWQLTPEQSERLDTASYRTPPYPYWHQNQFQPERLKLS